MEKQITTLITLDKESKEAIAILKENGMNISALIRKFLKEQVKKINKKPLK